MIVAAHVILIHHCVPNSTLLHLELTRSKPLYSPSTTSLPPLIAPVPIDLDPHNANTMANSEDIINWPFVDATSPTKETDTAKAVQPNTPYRPHNNYTQDAQKYTIRKRLRIYLVSLGISVFSDIVSITLYILEGLQQHEYAWIFRTWVVVSAGLTVLFGLLAASFWINYRGMKKLEGGDHGETDTPLKALGRKGLFESFSWAGEATDADAGEEVQKESLSVAREPLVKHRKQLCVCSVCAFADMQ
jgi:hypothetical protein